MKRGTCSGVPAALDTASMTSPSGMQPNSSGRGRSEDRTLGKMSGPFILPATKSVTLPLTGPAMRDRAEGRRFGWTNPPARSPCAEKFSTASPR